MIALYFQAFDGGILPVLLFLFLFIILPLILLSGIAVIIYKFIASWKQDKE
jgi:thiosulfate reductase cytochrome b subunit